MSNLDSSHTSKSTPPRNFQPVKLIPVVLKMKETYGLWQQYLIHFPKSHRYTIGSKIDTVFLDAIEYCFLASYTAQNQKIVVLERSISRIDLLKLLMQLAWDIKALDTNKYVQLSEPLSEIGKMLGGWRRQLTNKTPEVLPQEKQ